MNNHMMAAVLYGKEHLQVEPVAVPRIDSGDILVRVRVALTCGTDVKVFRRGYHARMIVPPAVFGHELAGDVVAVGEDVTSFQWASAWWRPIRRLASECFFCRRGLREPVRGPAVQQRRLRRIHPHSGAHRGAQHLSDSARTSSYQDAALIEPLACVLRGLEETAPRPGDTVAIIGLGPIGLMFVRLAKLYGCRVIAVGRRQTQLDRAAALGADELVVADDAADPVQAGARPDRRTRRGYRHRSRGQAARPGSGPSNMVRRGGTVNFFGGCPNDTAVDARYQPAALLRDHLQGQLPSHARATSARRWTWCRAGDITASFFVNREEPLANLLEVMRHLMSHNGHLKTAIIP